MAQPYVGQIRIFAGNFAPAGWMFCEGQILPIAEYDALFYLIGTTYGGDGQSTFALPDLRGRIPIHQGNGFILAETGGAEEITLTVNQIPAHSHPLKGGNMVALASNEGDSQDPTAKFPTITPGVNLYSKTALENVNMAAPQGVNQAGILQASGGSQPHSNFQPYTVVNYIISLFGIFPSPT
ncbi:phage tail protein [Belliella aquatica]|uniref:Tail Collar domain-containing protein n=1 Tax=Belliella aquatica TaxID=1323734 RepID=A0ABQ1MYH5_9BACT|nr:tail fiber protein [Belliella aquatica]MCH7407453.1 tail fiber protein [Belliella aquatica]GGC49327.1 tail Collar domain-containing protein [Belliella aquatica]